jgi:hypothetical protein
MMQICKNDRCSNIVMPNEKGRPKLFCSARCRRRYYSRREYQTLFGNGLMMIDEKNRPKINRTLSRTAEEAARRYKKHLDDCPLYRGPCPGRYDPHGQQKRCLIAAVLADDWRYLLQLEGGVMKPRRSSTSVSGYWLSDLTPEEIKEEEKRFGRRYSSYYNFTDTQLQRLREVGFFNPVEELPE